VDVRREVVQASKKPKLLFPLPVVVDEDVVDRRKLKAKQRSLPKNLPLDLPKLHLPQNPEKLVDEEDRPRRSLVLLQLLNQMAPQKPRPGQESNEGDLREKVQRKQPLSRKPGDLVEGEEDPRRVLPKLLHPHRIQTREAETSKHWIFSF
jgi:hypothetical protein